MLRRVETLLRDSPKKDIFLRHRDHAVEDKTAELFKLFLPTGRRIWRNVCEMPTGEFEHDLLIQLENRFLVVESKATQPKEPFRDPDRAYLRIQRDFKSDQGIQKAYEQANRLRRLLLSQDTTTLYDSQGKIVVEISGPIQEVFCICVTAESYGIVATNLAPLLEKDASDPWPWAISVIDLETILDGFIHEGKNIEDFLSFLRQRSTLHGRIFSIDELEIVGLYLRFGSFNRYLNRKGAIIFSGPDTSNIFDEIYFERHGTPRPKRQDIGQSPVLVDVEQELQRMMEQTDPTHGLSKKPKIGRNQLCPCGSGLKFKRCHGK